MFFSYNLGIQIIKKQMWQICCTCHLKGQTENLGLNLLGSDVLGFCRDVYIARCELVLLVPISLKKTQSKSVSL